MNKGLGKLTEYPVTSGQVKMINYFLSLDSTGLYIREVLNIILRRGTYNSTSISILNGLRNKYMQTTKHNMTKYYIVIDGTDSYNPIKSYTSMLDAREISTDIHIIYAASAVQARELFLTNVRLKNE